ncbi:hypothetical protein GGS21DRAFT_147372 [Xylaria nigripes]|nr:hypothetical protein GGS21DRAFT_147372 [Xylaria nigripes]
MYCYCSNFYGPSNCRNRVFLFGDRCYFCRSSNTGSSTNYALKFSTPLQWDDIFTSRKTEHDKCVSDSQSSTRSSECSSDADGFRRHKSKSN